MIFGDCCVSWQFRKKGEIHRDELQKIYILDPSFAIAYSTDDVMVVQEILRNFDINNWRNMLAEYNQTAGVQLAILYMKDGSPRLETWDSSDPEAFMEVERGKSRILGSGGEIESLKSIADKVADLPIEDVTGLAALFVNDYMQQYDDKWAEKGVHGLLHTAACSADRTMIVYQETETAEALDRWQGRKYSVSMTYDDDTDTWFQINKLTDERIPLVNLLRQDLEYREGDLLFDPRAD